MEPTIGFQLGNIRKIKCTQMQYKQRHALTSHINPCVRREQQNISTMEMLLSACFPLFFELTPNISLLVQSEKNPWSTIKVTKGFPWLFQCPIKPWGETILGHLQAPKAETHFIPNPLHLTHGIKISSHENQGTHFLISTSHYNHLKSWTHLDVGVLTMQVHPAMPYRRLPPSVLDSSPPT